MSSTPPSGRDADPTPEASEASGVVERAPADAADAPARTPWVVHGIGLALAALFIWLLAPTDAPPPPQSAPQPAPEASKAGVGDPNDGKSRRARARQRDRSQITGRLPPGESAPVAVDSGFRRPFDGANDADLRAMYLSTIFRVADENILGGLQFNRATYATTIKAGNATFDYGVAMHPPTTGSAVATFKIPEGARNFQATLLLANAGSPTFSQCESQGGSVTFIVKADDAEIYRRIVVGNDGPHAQIQLDLNPGMRQLSLVTDSADGDSTCDGAVWGIARFMVDPPKPANANAADGAAGKR